MIKFFCSLICLTGCLWGYDSDKFNFRIDSGREILHGEDVTLSEAWAYVTDKVVDRPYDWDLKKCIAIFDVNGTMTNESEPSTEKPTEFTEREKSTEFIRFLMEKGIDTYVSSAWDVFYHTLERLRALGISQSLEIPDNVQASDVVEDLHIHRDSYGETVSLFYYKIGKVISVQNPSTSLEFYPNKAFSPLVSSTLNPDDIQLVLFFDDNASNIDLFGEDVLNHNLYPNARICLFRLSDPAKLLDKEADVEKTERLSGAAADIDFQQPVENAIPTAGGEAPR